MIIRFFHELQPMTIVLASASTYRARLLAKLQLPFISVAAGIDESALPDESHRQQVSRLAQAKAKVIQELHPDSVIIGSDQMAVVDSRVLGKPGSLDKARLQLGALSGREVQFLTSLCVLAPGMDPQASIDTTTIWFRDLAEAEIARYVEIDQPIDCVGSFKVESLGASLFTRLECADPDAIIGLPLITLAGFLRHAGITLP